MALVWFSRLRSAPRRAAVHQHGVIDRVPVTGQFVGHFYDGAAPCRLGRWPTWPTVAHVAAVAVSRQFFAAMRWSSSTQVFFGHVGFTLRTRCFFHASFKGLTHERCRDSNPRSLHANVQVMPSQPVGRTHAHKEFSCCCCCAVSWTTFLGLQFQMDCVGWVSALS